MPPELIVYDRVSKWYGGGLLRPRVSVFQDVSLTVHRHETVGLYGPSGCGKSTLLRMLLGLTACDGGCIRFCGRDIRAMTRPERKRFHQAVQIVFQNPQDAFNPRYRLEHALREPLRLFPSDSRPPDSDWIRRHLDLLGLEPALLSRFPHQLSGGQLQRLALLRALLLEPDCLLLDEATAMLDVSIQAQLMQLFRRFQSERGMSLVLVSHDRALVRQMCQTVYCFEADGLTAIRST